MQPSSFRQAGTDLPLLPIRTAAGAQAALLGCFEELSATSCSQVRGRMGTGQQVTRCTHAVPLVGHAAPPAEPGLPCCPACLCRGCLALGLLPAGRTLAVCTLLAGAACAGRWRGGGVRPQPSDHGQASASVGIHATPHTGLQQGTAHALMTNVACPPPPTPCRCHDIPQQCQQWRAPGQAPPASRQDQHRQCVWQVSTGCSQDGGSALHPAGDCIACMGPRKPAGPLPSV